MRREADGVAWFLESQGLQERAFERTLELRWTCLSGQEAIAVHLGGVIGVVCARMGGLGLPVVPGELTAVAGFGRPKPYALDEAGLARLASVLAGEAYAHVYVTLFTQPARGRRQPFVSIGMGGSLRDRGVWSGYVRPAQALGTFGIEGDPRLDEEAEAWSAMLVEICRRSGAAWGSVMLDYLCDLETTYEEYFGIGAEGEPQSGSHPRGYFWANVLSAGHVAGLGGRAVVQARCAELGLSVRPLGVGADSALLLVRDPGPICAFDDERLAAVRDLLDPILIHHPYYWYAGPPLRLFKEPGTACLPVPDGLDPHLLVFDDDEPMTEDGQ